MKSYILSGYKRILAIMIAFVCAVSLCIPLTVYAEENEADRTENQPVRVGWYQSDMFQEGLSDEDTKSGYCYDYLQKISDYTAWKYKYVYGSWAELFHKLETGEIDFLGGVSITEERREIMLFPDSAMGTDQYYLYKRSDDSTISASDLSTLDGKKLGGIENNHMTTLAKKWIEENDVDLEIVYFESFEEQETAFQNGEIDLLVQTINNVLRMEDISILVKIGEEPFYLAVSKSRRDLLDGLNASLNTMLSIDPFMLQNLQYSNYGATLTSKTMTEEEKMWVESHDTMVVGYLDNYLPYSTEDENGQASGLMTDVLEAILKSMGLEDDLNVEYRAFASYNEMEAALREKRVDVAFPVYGNLWDLEQDGIDASSGVVTSSESFFYKGTYDKDQIRSVAVNENNAMQIAYCRRNFPNAEMKTYSSIEDCLTAVKDGRADGTIVNTLRTDLVTRNSKFKSLSYVQLDIEDSRCFGLNEEDMALLLLLNRGLRLIGSSYGIDHSYKYIESFYSYGALDFIKDNMIGIALILAFVVFSIILFLIVSIKRKERIVKEKETAIRQVNEFNRELEVLKKKADAANAAKTLFLNNMSHDIRTPMNAIIGYTNIAAKHAPKPEVKKCLDKIRESSDHLLSLINDVLDISRIESGKTKINLALINMDVVVDEVLDIVHGFLDERKLTFRVNKRTMENPYVIADALRIREVLVNILSNAVKFTDDGGCITFVFETCSGKDDRHMVVRYIVSDTGVGMTKEFQKHIFDEFAQENSNSARTQYKGTGLGMAITKRYVDMMGGTILVQSEKGKGTTFTVELPLEIADGDAVQKQEEPVAFRELNGIHVLLAEDNELNAEIAMIQLEEEGMMITRAVDGRQAVEIFKNNPPDTFQVILMDIMMPEMNGYEATRTIRNLSDRPDGANIPIIAMTANAFAEDIQASLDTGMDAHLAKPLAMDEVLKTISRSIERIL